MKISNCCFLLTLFIAIPGFTGPPVPSAVDTQILKLLEVPLSKDPAQTWKYQMTPKWELSESGFYTFFWLITLEAKIESPLSEVTAHHSELTFSNGENQDAKSAKILVRLVSLSETLQLRFKNGSSKELQLLLTYDKIQWIDRNCQNEKISILEVSKSSDPLKGYFALRCDRVDSTVEVTLSYPSELTFDSKSNDSLFKRGTQSSKFLIHSKSLKSESPAPLSLAAFELTQQIRSQRFELQWKSNYTEKVPEKSSESKIEKIAGPDIVAKTRFLNFGLGVLQLNIDSPSGVDSALKPAAMVQFYLHFKKNRYSLGLEGLQSLPAAITKTYITHTETMAMGEARLLQSKNWRLSTKAFLMIVDGMSQKLSFFYNRNAIGFGISAHYKSLPNKEFFLDAQSAISRYSLFSIRARTQYSVSKSNLIWGNYLSLSSMQIPLFTSELAKAQQIGAAIYILF